MENCPFTDILNKLSEHLGCPSSPFAIREQKPGPGFYVRKLPLYGPDGKVLEERFLTLPGTGGFFLRAAVDCVADSVERREVSLLTPHAFSDNGEEVPLSSLAEFYHASLHRWLALSFKRMFGICFETINRLSASPYEGDAAQGVLAFLPLMIDGEDGSLSRLLQVDFQPKNRPVFSVGYIKQVRKVFAGAGNGAMLVVREGDTSQEMRCRGYLNREDALCFPYHAELWGPYQWILYEGCTPLFNIEFDRCKVYRDPLETAMYTLRQELRKTDAEFSPIRDALVSVSRQCHGATLLFLDLGNEVVKDRIDKLIEYRRAIAIGPLPLSQPQCTELLTSLGRIDGAIVVDISTCAVSCIGTLLDGEAAVAGDPARGSRHNSISALFSSLVVGCRQAGRPVPQGAAAIFSEDGGCQVMTISGVTKQMDCGRVPAAAHQA